MYASPPQVAILTDPKLFAIHTGLTGHIELYAGFNPAKVLKRQFY
jgi:hypothetical protein